MRPIRLEAEGFTCYRDRQEPLDFSGLSLFAIAGPTGAGKSSILDTMLYALYGEVPRIGKQGIGEFIAHGRDVLSVCLDFSVRGTVYRVARRVKRGKKGTLSTAATLAEITGGTERSLADNVRPVNEAIASLLGLDYDAFTQTVILPQGEFARFLRAEPKSQRGILQHLLRHHVFERMRAEAERRRADIDAELRGVERQLQSYAGATDDALSAKGVALTVARELLERVSVERTSLDVEVQESRRRRQLTEELSRLKTERTAIEARDAQITIVRAELALARRAAEIAPRLEADHAAAHRAKEAVTARDKASKVCSELSDRQASAEANALAASKSAEQCEAMSERIRRIDEMKGDLERRQILTTEVEGLTQAIPVTRNNADETQGRLKAAQAAVHAAQVSLQERRTAVDATVYDGAQDALIESLWTRVVQTRAISEEIERLEREHQKLVAAVGQAEVHEAVVRQAQVQALAAASEASVAAAAAGIALDEARTRHRAAALRSHLHAGESCPVCLQTVARVPAIDAPPELDTLTRKRNAAETHQHATEQASQKAAQILAAAEASLAGAVAARDSSAATTRERVGARNQLNAAIVAALESTAPGLDANAPLAWIESRRVALRAAKQAHDGAEELLRRAEASARAAEFDVVTAEAASRESAAEHARLVDEHRRSAAELESVLSRITAVSTHADPGIERTELANRVLSLQTQERNARSALTDVQQQAAAASARLTSATAAASSAEQDAMSIRSALENALRVAGFSRADEVAAAVRSPQQMSELESAIRTYEDGRAAVLRRLLEVEPEIAGKEIDAPTLAAIEKRFSDSVNAWRAAGEAVSRLESEHARLVKDVEKRMQLVAEQKGLRGQLSVTAEMAADLKGDSFQEYLLEEAFHALVAGASIRMRQISNRYTLQWEAGDFYVVDHDNAGDRRRAETLSGGETFMASLCLALQLSDEVLRTSGALQMDSLFIDEGFGTLDSDSLSEVTDAIEALRQDGGRLIGVISHRPELTDRLPGCIRVNKGAGESSWALERVG
jgi:DNA repair protein SbcC/Rad50